MSLNQRIPSQSLRSGSPLKNETIVTPSTKQRISKKEPQHIFRRHISESSWTLWNWYRHLHWYGLLTTVIIPLVGLAFTVKTTFNWYTVIWSCFYYCFTATCVIAGYHRLWAHRSFIASYPIQFIYAFFGSSVGIGSIKWWASAHRAHHRYSDTEKDPHTIRKGLVYSHIGWMTLRPHPKVRNSVKECLGDDLINDTLIDWQEKNYNELLILTGLMIPSFIAGIFWDDYLGGLIFAGILRGALVQNSTFLVNSLGHCVGTQPFDDKKSCRNNWFLSFLTWGEGNNNFHYEFSADFRNGINWFDFDPVKYHLIILEKLKLVKNLYRASESSISQCLLQYQQKLIDKRRAKLNWGVPIDQLPIISPEEFRKWANDEKHKRALIAVAGIVHDVTPFVNDHPGGVALIKTSIGKDATSAFNGAVYDHSTAAHNLLATMRVAVLSGRTEEIVWKQQQQENKEVPLKQDSTGQKIVRGGEQATIIKKPVRTAGAA